MGMLVPSAFGGGLPKPKKKDRFNERRKREIKRDISSFGETIKERARVGDLYRCERCKRLFSKDKIHAHHKQRRNVRPDLRTDISNGEALCWLCHRKEHDQ
jgi:hypothetical protein